MPDPEQPIQHQSRRRSSRSGTAARALERGLWMCGCLLITVAISGLVRSDVRAARAATAVSDMSLWSESRKLAYLAAIAAEPAPVLGTLRAPSLGLSVPIYGSASELNMDRGAGVIDGMSYPHEPGHIGIAGHRDGYFRSLKDIQTGEIVTLETLQGDKHFRVDELLIVDAENTSLLEDSIEQRLTIVTCYPFYFVGSAPQRFLVRASPVTPNVFQAHEDERL